MAYIKDILRTIGHERRRLIALMIITVLGVMMFTGFRASVADLQKTADDFYDDLYLHDIEIMSTLGLTKDDVNTIADLSFVDQVQGVYSEDVTIMIDDKSHSIAIRTMKDGGLDQPLVLEGHLPQEKNEIAVPKAFLDDTGLKIGDKITIIEKPEKDQTNNFPRTEFTIAASIISVLSVDNPAGTGSFRATSTTEYTFFVPESAVISTVYTSVVMTVNQVRGLNCYSEEYENIISEITKTIEEGIKEERQKARYDAIQQQGKDELEKATHTAMMGFVNAWDELSDGQSQIDEGLEDLYEGRKELDDGWDEIRDGEIELNDAKNKADREFANAKDQLASSRRELNEGLAQIESSQRDIDNGRVSIEEGFEELAAQKEQVLDQLEQVQEALPQIEDGVDQINDGIGQIQDGIDQIDEAIEQTDDGIAQLDEGISSLESNLSSVESSLSSLGSYEEDEDPSVTEQRESLQAQKQELSSSLSEYKRQRDDLSGQRSILSAKKTSLQYQMDDLLAQRDDLWNQYDQLEDAVWELENALDEIDSYEADLRQKQIELENGQKELNAAKDQAMSGLAQLNSGEAELASKEQDAKNQLAQAAADLEDGRKKLNEGEAEYNDGLEELNKAKDELEDGFKTYQDKYDEVMQELEDARKELEDLDKATWYIQDRNILGGWSNVKADSDSVIAMGTVFPVLFLIVAILISLTTITRMVEENRGLLGVYQALGYSDAAIRRKYLVYTLVATVFGGLIGNVMGFLVMPNMNFVFFKNMYMFPSYTLTYNPVMGIIGIMLFSVSIAMSAIITCQKVLKDMPATLMRPKAPKAGSRIFLERIKPIWRHMSFLNKVTARNLFRYKKRLLMTVFGIAGCTALILTGYCVKNTINDLLVHQYGEITDYDMMAVSMNNKDLQTAKVIFDHSDDTSEYQMIRLESIKVYGEDEETMSLQLYVLPDGGSFDGYINILSTDGEEIHTLEDGCYLTQNASDVLKIAKGDPIRFQNVELDVLEGTTTAIVKNYLGNSLFMTESYYRSIYSEDGDDYLPNAMLVNLHEGSDAAALAETLKARNEILSVTNVAEDLETFDKSFQSVNFLVYIIITMAAALAFVVLFTLSTTNISERERELATIKVLGFYDGEVHRYVNKETIILTLIGIAVGMPMGMGMRSVLDVALQLPSMYMKFVIHPASYGIAFAMSLCFALVVNLLTNGILNKIDPAEALKSIE